MLLNIKPWELVKHGPFVVGESDIVIDGVTLHPGEMVPPGNEHALFYLYDLNQITPIAPMIETRKSKRKKF